MDLKLKKLIVPNWDIIISTLVPLNLYGIMKPKNCLSCSCSDIETSVTAPVYEIPPAKYSAEKILKILCDPSISSSKICTTMPVQVTTSATYVLMSPSFLIRMTLKRTFSECGTTQGHIHRHAGCTSKKMIMLPLKSVPLVLRERMWSTSVGSVVFILQTTSSNG